MGKSMEFEIDKDRINFRCVWRIGKIDIDKVTFIKYGIERMKSMSNGNKEIVVLKEVMGDETHKCNTSVIEELSGKVGEVIKEFVVERKGKNIKISKIVWLEKNY